MKVFSPKMLASLLLLPTIAVIECSLENTDSEVCSCFGRNLTDRTDPGPDGINLNLSACELKSLCSIGSLCEDGVTAAAINISWNYIKEINLDAVRCLWQNISVIDFSANDIYLVQSDAFAGVVGLKQLNMSRNSIYKIQTGAFSNLSRLQRLDLSENNLPGVHKGMINGMQSLKTLSLAKNKILYIEPGCFSSFEKLETLDLSGNLIAIINKEAFLGLHNLRQLNLGENKLHDGQFDFLGVFEHLNELDISRNRLVGFEQNAFYGYNVVSIDASNNDNLLIILQSAFLDMPFLQTVDLNACSKLYFVHEETFINLPNLTIVNLTDTKIRFLPEVNNTTLTDATRTKLNDSCYDMNLVNRSRLEFCIECVGDAFMTKFNAGSADAFKTKLKAGSVDAFKTKFKAGSAVTPFIDTLPTPCGPIIVSNIRKKFSVILGQTINIACLAVGNPWPGVKWQRAILVQGRSVFETTKTGYFLKLHIGSLNDEGNYRCVAESDNGSDIKSFNINIFRIDIGIRILTADSTSIVITWNRTHHVTRHVILYRAFEETTEYRIQKLSEYWKLFRIDSLKPFTQYEVCIASKLDINDKNCVRTTTTSAMEKIPGIRHDIGVIAVLTISGFVFGLTLLATLYKCVHKLRIITKQNVFIVNSESRESFSDASEPIFTYENQFSDFLLDNEDKTEF